MRVEKWRIFDLLAERCKITDSLEMGWKFNDHLKLIAEKSPKN